MHFATDRSWGFAPQTAWEQFVCCTLLAQPLALANTSFAESGEAFTHCHAEWWFLFCTS
jgi:hypothetical protein